MARRADFYTQVGDGERAVSVGYSAPVRDSGFLGVRFTGPEGQRLERMTGCRKVDANYHIEAAKIIAKAFAASYPDAITRTTWAEAMQEVDRTAGDLRPATIASFHTATKQLRTTLDADDKTPKKPTSPADITPELASRFCRLFLSTPYTRGKSKVQRKRSPTTMMFYIRSLSALWGQFRELGYTTANPWRDVRRPQLERKQKSVPTEADIAHFFGWIQAKYPTWERLHALVSLKLLSGCRTADICQLKTAQVKAGQLVFSASQTKTRSGRVVPLPEELFQTLTKIAGREWLWDGWNDDLRKYRKGCNPIPETFQASTVHCVLGNIFREYSEANPDHPRLSPHALRRRAITVMTLATQSVDLTAQALGLNPHTARNYYLDSARAFNTADAFRLASPLLLPPNPHHIPTKSGNNGEQQGTDTNNRESKSA